MDKELEQQIKEHLSMLPKKTQEVLRSFDWTTRLKEMGERHGLLLDELGHLQAETTLALVGITPPEDYQINLRKHMNISNDLAAALVKDVNAMIFLPIQELILAENSEASEEHEELFVEKQEKENGGEEHLLRKDVLAGVENPEKNTPSEEKSISKLKLGDIFTKAPAATDHEASTAPVAPQKKATYDAGDPYHEPLE